MYCVQIHFRLQQERAPSGSGEKNSTELVLYDTLPKYIYGQYQELFVSTTAASFSWFRGHFFHKFGNILWYNCFRFDDVIGSLWSTDLLLKALLTSGILNSSHHFDIKIIPETTKFN